MEHPIPVAAAVGANRKDNNGSHHHPVPASPLSMSPPASAVTNTTSREVFQGLFQDLGKQAMAMEAILRLICGKVDKLETWMTEISFGMTELDLKLRNIAHNIEGTSANVDDDAASVHRWAAPPPDDPTPSSAAGATGKRKPGSNKKSVKMTGMVASIMDTLSAPRAGERDKTATGVGGGTQKKKSAVANVVKKASKKKHRSHHHTVAEAAVAHSYDDDDDDDGTASSAPVTERPAPATSHAAGGTLQVQRDESTGAASGPRLAAEISDLDATLPMETPVAIPPLVDGNNVECLDQESRQSMDSERSFLSDDGGIDRNAVVAVPVDPETEKHSSISTQRMETLIDDVTQLAIPAELATQRDEKPQPQEEVGAQEGLAPLAAADDAAPTTVLEARQGESIPEVVQTQVSEKRAASSCTDLPSPPQHAIHPEQASTDPLTEKNPSLQLLEKEQELDPVAGLAATSTSTPLKKSSSRKASTRRKSQMVPANAETADAVVAPPAETVDEFKAAATTTAPTAAGVVEEDGKLATTTIAGPSNDQEGHETTEANADDGGDDSDDDSDDDESDEEESDEEESDENPSGSESQEEGQLEPTARKHRNGPDASTATRTITALKKLKKADMLTPAEEEELKQRAHEKWFKLKGHIKEKKKKDVANILLKRKKNVFTVSARIELLEEKSKVRTEVLTGCVHSFISTFLPCLRLLNLCFAATHMQEVYASIKQLNTDLKTKVDLSANDILRRQVHDVNLSLQALDHKLTHGTSPAMEKAAQLGKDLEHLRASFSQQISFVNEEMAAMKHKQMTSADEHRNHLDFLSHSFQKQVADLVAENEARLRNLPDHSAALEGIKRTLRKKADLKLLKECVRRIVALCLCDPLSVILTNRLALLSPVALKPVCSVTMPIPKTALCAAYPATKKS